MTNLVSQLQEQKKVSETTANAYVRSLYSLNNKTPFKNLAWTKKTDEILSKITSDYAESTQRTLLATLVSVLSLQGPSYKKALKTYTQKMNSAVDDDSKKPKDVKTEKQAENWVDWSDVLEKKKELEESTNIKKPDWNSLLQRMVLSLYTDIAPRRNLDYLVMNVVSKSPEETDKNWLDLKARKFVFNKYKTAKTYGQQTVDIPDELMKTIVVYLKNHPLWNKDSKKSKEGVPFLVSTDGKELKAGNCITRILNSIIGKRVGSSMLRHSYLTTKYGKEDTEREKDATAMGHSVAQQKEYVLTKEPEEKLTHI